MTPLTILFGFLFMAAQGFAIFLTAGLAASFTRMETWWGKIVWMIISYLGWVVFTVFLFVFLGADVFIIPMAGAMSAFISATVFLVGWIFIPVLRAKQNG